MSADNWTDCPKCKQKAETEFNATLELLAHGYGRMPEDEYLKLHKDILAGVIVKSETVREDYEIGIYDGEFCVSYRASCNANGCGFELSFEHNEKIVPVKG